MHSEKCRVCVGVSAGCPVCLLICYDTGNVATILFRTSPPKAWHLWQPEKRFSSQSAAAMSIYLLTLAVLTRCELIATRKANLAGTNFVVEWRSTWGTPQTAAVLIGRSLINGCCSCFNTWRVIERWKKYSFTYKPKEKRKFTTRLLLLVVLCLFRFWFYMMHIGDFCRFCRVVLCNGVKM